MTTGRRGRAGVRRLISELASVQHLGGPRVAARYGLSLLRHGAAVVSEGTLAAADAGMSGRVWTFRVDGRDIAFDGYSFGVAREIYGRRAYFAAAGFSVGPGDTVLDLGANAGIFTILAARLGARVVAVEANPACLGLLASNIRRNGAGEAVDVEHALVGGGGLLAAGGEPILGRATPPLVSIDELAERHGLEAIDFLKVDIEGSEFDLFARTGGWLDRVRRIAMEVHPEHGDPESLAQRLTGAGFQLELRDAALEPAQRLEPPAGFLYAWRS